MLEINDNVVNKSRAVVDWDNVPDEMLIPKAASKITRTLLKIIDAWADDPTSSKEGFVALQLLSKFMDKLPQKSSGLSQDEMEKLFDVLKQVDPSTLETIKEALGN